MHHTTLDGSTSASKRYQDSKAYIYKKSSYQYLDSGKGYIQHNPKERSIDQLDALLEDLKTERELTKEKDVLKISSNYGTIDRSHADLALSSMKLINDDKTANQYDGSAMIGNANSALKYRYNRECLNSTRAASASHNVSDYKTSTVSVQNDNEAETDFKNLALSESILPIPGTKVTTTVRTYTYEIPFEKKTDFSSANLKSVSILQNESNNQSLNYPLHWINTPHTANYNTECYSIGDKDLEYSEIVKQSNGHHDKFITNNAVTTNLKSQYNVDITQPAFNNQNTHIYNFTENTQRTSDPISTRPYENKSFYQESSTVATDKTDTHINKLLAPNFNIAEPGFGKVNVMKTYTVSEYNATPTRSPQYGTVNHISTPPFPVDRGDFRTVNRDPPQKVDELMESLSNGEFIDKSEVQETYHKNEIETSVATPNMQNLPTINKVGKEIYYPPGHEMKIYKTEEERSGNAAGGRWAKGSGMYEYESGYKSKSKTTSGGAMVPVCLPLCCAMPCSIM